MKDKGKKVVDPTVHEPEVEVVTEKVKVVDETAKQSSEMIGLGKFLMDFSKEVYLKDPTNPMYELAKAQTNNMYLSLCIVFNQNAAAVLSVPNNKYPELIEMLSSFSIEVPKIALTVGADTTQVDLAKTIVPEATKELFKDEVETMKRFRVEPKPEEIVDVPSLVAGIRYFMSRSGNNTRENITDALKFLRIHKNKFEPDKGWLTVEEDEIFRELLTICENPGAIFQSLIRSIFVRVTQLDSMIIGHMLIKNNLPHIKDDIIASIVRQCIQYRSLTVEKQELKDRAMNALRGMTKDKIDELVETGDASLVKEIKSRMKTNYEAYLEADAKENSISLTTAMKNLIVKINNCYSASKLELYKEEGYPEQQELFDEKAPVDTPAAEEPTKEDAAPAEAPKVETPKVEEQPKEDVKPEEKKEPVEKPTPKPTPGNPKKPEKKK